MSDGVMSDRYTPPPRNVVLIRSVFLGLAAGAVIGMMFAGALSIAQAVALSDLLGALWVGFLIGGTIGMFTGLVLGLVLYAIGPDYQHNSSLLRVGVAVATVVCGYVALSLLARRPLADLYTVALLIPAGVGAWFLLPIVLRPTAR
jgi:LytS/YehU family sensor histidine kinase